MHSQVTQSCLNKMLRDSIRIYLELKGRYRPCYVIGLPDVPRLTTANFLFYEIFSCAGAIYLHKTCCLMDWLGVLAMLAHYLELQDKVKLGLIINSS